MMDWAHVPCIDRWILHYWTTREVSPSCSLLKNKPCHSPAQNLPRTSSDTKNKTPTSHTTAHKCSAGLGQLGVWYVTDAHSTSTKCCGLNTELEQEHFQIWYLGSYSFLCLLPGSQLVFVCVEKRRVAFDGRRCLQAETPIPQLVVMRAVVGRRFWSLRPQKPASKMGQQGCVPFRGSREESTSLSFQWIELSCVFLAHDHTSVWPLLPSQHLLRLDHPATFF